MKIKHQRLLGTFLVTFAAISLAISACNPTYDRKTISECEGTIGSGQYLGRVTWTCCDKENLCTNGAAKRQYRSANVFSNSTTGLNCWKNAVTSYDQQNPCCKKQAIEEEPTPLLP